MCMCVFLYIYVLFSIYILYYIYSFLFSSLFMFICFVFSFFLFLSYLLLFCVCFYLFVHFVGAFLVCVSVLGDRARATKIISSGYQATLVLIDGHPLFIDGQEKINNWAIRIPLIYRWARKNHLLWL